MYRNYEIDATAESFKHTIHHLIMKNSFSDIFVGGMSSHSCVCVCVTEAVSWFDSELAGPQQNVSRTRSGGKRDPAAQAQVLLFRPERGLAGPCPAKPALCSGKLKTTGGITRSLMCETVHIGGLLGLLLFVIRRQRMCQCSAFSRETLERWQSIKHPSNPGDARQQVMYGTSTWERV